MKYRKKPLIVEAITVHDALCIIKHNGNLPTWLDKACERCDVIFAKKHVNICTLEATMHGDEDDWIIQGIKGEIYPCKADIFTSTYEPVGDDF